jgi:DNA-binding response OmpR family regulator
MANVLVVEDNKTLNQAYKLILQRENHDVRVAFNGYAHAGHERR